MMFAARGVAVSLAFFVLFYCLLSALVAGGWRAFRLRRLAESWRAGLLFALRVFPFAAAVALTLVLVVPSFQLLEPRSMDVDEGMGAFPLALGVGALLLMVCGCFRVVAALIDTSRVVAGWLEGARPVDVSVNRQSQLRTVFFCAKRYAPPLTLVGVRKPRVLVSESTVAVLSQNELNMALHHELGHVRSRDNLKKLVFRFCPFPGMAGLEHAWSQAAEMAADDAAVSNAGDALDLAAALVKLSRLVSVNAAPVCTVGLVTGSITARVERLLRWNEAEARATRTARTQPWYAIPAVLATLACLFSTYGSALVLTHEITEWLVR
jgi:Zn-dependent protease with chaperone function